jgi:membrane fusion protein, heavy metal efflux system
VFENDLKTCKLGQFADVRLNAYPDQVFRARISNIGPILDPNIRTAKVRLEVENSGLMRLGMFVTATFHGSEKQILRDRAGHGHPASARPRLGLCPGGGKSFRARK